jgi:hypothetical protein
MIRIHAMAKRSLFATVVAGLCVLAPAAVRAQVTAPSVYTTAIQVQGETLGTEFDDWASSGITVADMDALDNPGGSPPSIDIADVQIANDDDFIYVHVTTHGGHTSFGNLFLAFDTDQNVATGFDPFALGVIGSELGYQTDFPFGQAAGVYNTGATISGPPPLNGGAFIFPFWTEAGAPQGTEMEWAVPRSVMINGSPAFTGDSFDLAIWADSGFGDISQRISYTFAEPPDGLPGDYNDDDKVDAADYVVYRKNENTMNPLPNDPHGGTIGADQYNTWAANFGSMAGSGSVAAVPEPATAGLLLAAVVALGVARRRF